MNFFFSFFFWSRPNLITLRRIAAISIGWNACTRARFNGQRVVGIGRGEHDERSAKVNSLRETKFIGDFFPFFTTRACMTPKRA